MNIFIESARKNKEGKKRLSTASFEGIWHYEQSVLKYNQCVLESSIKGISKNLPFPFF